MKREYVSAEVALAILTVARGVLVGLVDRLRGDLKDVGTTTIITFGGFDDLLVTGVGDCTTFNSGHLGTPLSAVVGHKALDDFCIWR